MLNSKLFNNIGCYIFWFNISTPSMATMSSDWLSGEVVSSSNGAELVMLFCFLTANIENYEAIWFFVSHNSMLKINSPSWLFALLICNFTNSGFCFLPVMSPMSNICLKYFFCSGVNLQDLHFDLIAHPSTTGVQSPLLWLSSVDTEWVFHFSYTVYPHFFYIISDLCITYHGFPFFSKI